jgi:hypothetical protein
LSNTLAYPEGGGHRWAYLNWALGLKSLGCEVVWLELVEPDTPAEQLRTDVAVLNNHLEPYGLSGCVALCGWDEQPLQLAGLGKVLDLDAAAEADLLLDMAYSAPTRVVSRFQRSALIDIDPGLLQAWISAGALQVAPHDIYFTIGETVGRPGARFPDAELEWHYTPPCVALDWWPPVSADPRAAFTTVSHWYGGEWVEHDGESYPNNKRDGFLPFLDLPRHTSQQLELALCLSPDEGPERRALEKKGWRVVDAGVVSSTPWGYQQYIQRSRGEFSCAKPSCIRFQNSWVSDRTLCYLASGKPAVVQYTGPSCFLPDAAGLFRFETLDEAAQALEVVGADYARQCRLARQLAEMYFDAHKVVGRVLEQVLP